MSSALALQPCRLVAPEKLQDRFLTSGILTQNSTYSLKDQVVITYVFEITKPMFSSGKVLPALLETLTEEQKKLNYKHPLDTQFEALLKEVNQALNTVSESGETDWIGSLNGLIMVISGDEVHFSQTGRCPAYLLQNNRIRQITDDPQAEFEPHPLKTFSNLASGHIHEGDQLLIANQELYQEISLDALRRILHTASPHQSNLAIARELKKQKNPAVATMIMKITGGPGEVAEPCEVLLEEEMQSSLMKFKKQLTPAAEAAKVLGAKIGAASLETAKHTGTLVKEKVAPKAEELWKKGKESAKTYSEQIGHKIHKEQPDEIDPAVVEVIGKKEALKDPHETIIKAAEERLEHTFGEEEEEFIPADDSPTTLQGKLQASVQSLPTLWKTSLKKSKKWFKVERNRKLSALTLAVFLIILTISGAFSGRGNEASPEKNVANAQLLEDVNGIEGRITTAIDLQQEVEAAKLVEDAQKQLLSLKDTNAEQKAEADHLWAAISAQADTLNKAVRLGDPAATYTLPENATGMLSMLPYFYGWSKQSNNLLRTGKGDPAEVSGSFRLNSSTDSILSAARSSEAESVAYALTKQNKVYRIIQTDGDTTLRPITTKTGDFDVGDAIGSFAGNVYILDGKTGLLWRYTNAGSGTYNSRESVIDGSVYDIKQSVSLAIDGAIYILKRDGSVMKFVRGRQEADFALKDQPYLSRTMVMPLQIVTNETTPSVYILDGGTTAAGRATSRILEFSKTGGYIRQYTFPEDMTDVRAFDINTKEKKLWVLNGAEVHEFNL